MADPGELDPICHIILWRFLSAGAMPRTLQRLQENFFMQPDEGRVLCHRERLNGKYVSSVAGYAPEFLENLKEITRKQSFWDPDPR